MIRVKSKFFRRFRKDEDGNASVEFFIVIPVFIMLMLMSIELSFITLRSTLLERGLDMAVREIRLGTGEPSSHGEIKDFICDAAAFIRNCDSELRLEMKPVDMRAFAALDDDAKCIENSQPVDPAVLKKDFVFGGVNEMMLLRACYTYDPIFPEDFLGSALQKDAHGKSSIITTTAFVQEPT